MFPGGNLEQVFHDEAHFREGFAVEIPTMSSQ